MDAIRDRTGRKGGQDPENLDITEIRESENYTRRSVPGMGDTPLEMYEDIYPSGDIVVFDSDEETIVFTCSKETNLIEGFVLGYLYQS